MPIYKIRNSNIPFERRKTIINANINNYNSNFNTINTINALNTINTLNTINSLNNSKNNFPFDLLEIFKLIRNESKTSSNSIDSYQINNIYKKK